MSRPSYWVTLLGLACGCSAAPVPGARERSAPPAEVRLGGGGDCRGAGIGEGARIGDARQSSTVALAERAEGLVAYVADSDGRALHVVDLGTGRVRSVPIDGAPEQALVLADGRVMVTISDGHRVEVYEPTDGAPLALVKRCERSVPAGPYALAVSEDDATIAVTSAWAPALTVLDGERLNARRVVSLPRSPRGVLISSGRAFVTHLAGSRLSVVGLEAGPQRSIALRTRAASPEADPEILRIDREAGQAYALAGVTVGPGSPEVGTLSGTAPPAGKPRTSRIVVPMVSIDPGDERRSSSMYYGPPPVAGVFKHAPAAAVIDPDAERSLSTYTLAVTWNLRAEECTLPRSISVEPATRRGFVACMGIDQVQVVDLGAADPMAAVMDRIAAPTGPTGAAPTPDGDKLVIYGELAGRLRIVELASGHARDIELPVLVDAATRRGRELFHASDDRGISSDGLACASCHPDGGDDGLTWTTPEGPRQTPMLAGRLKGTAPYGWSRGASDLPDYITDTVARLQGTGLSRGDLVALAGYVERLPLPPRPEPTALALAGREVFLSEGCADCHVDVEGTDRHLHAVGAGRHAVDTPSLRHVGSTGPYFHDGRYASLESLLSHSDMGRAPSLNAEQRVTLLAFLESL